MLLHSLFTASIALGAGVAKALPQAGGSSASKSASIVASSTAASSSASSTVKPPLPYHTYHSSPAEPVIYNYSLPIDAAVESKIAKDPKYILMSPGITGPAAVYSMKQTGPLITDVKGEPVWVGFLDNIRVSAQFQQQTYKNKSVLVVWNGTDLLGHGRGSCLVLNHEYKVVANITSNTTADIHECQITAQDTAYITSYYAVPADLSAYNVTDGYVLNSVAQEIDIATGKVIWEWNPMEHVKLTDSYLPLSGAGTEANPWDFFHLNSIKPDNNGNVLISSRHFSTIYLVNHTNGEIIWEYGGRHNDFTIGEGANHEWQHDARFHADDTEMTLFDNAAAIYAGGVIANESFSRGLRVKLDYEKMTVTLVQAYEPWAKNLTTSQGSVQPLSNGNVFIAWGGFGRAGEFTKDGQNLYSFSIGPAGGLGSTYRGYRADWEGYPTTEPSFAFSKSSSNVGYVSWNGATEVSTWQVLGSNDKTTWTKISSTSRSGFETKLSLGDGNHKLYWVKAFASDGKLLGGSANLSRTS